MNIVHDSSLKIKENILSYNKSFIQLSNISEAYVEKEEKSSYSLLGLLGLVVGIVFSMDVDFPWIGLGILFLSIIRLLPTFIRNRKKKYILVIATNSSRKIAFRCKQEEFLLEVLELIKNAVDSKANYEINLEQCTISNSQIGNNNVIKQAE